MADLHIRIGGQVVPDKYIEKSFSHSSGAGGQNVNKTSTKVHLRLELSGLQVDSLVRNLLNQAFPDGHVLAGSQETRSQHQNLELAYHHLQSQINDALVEVKNRRQKKEPWRTKMGKWMKAKKDRLQKWREGRHG
jgi:ribosome-associated protein